MEKHNELSNFIRNIAKKKGMKGITLPQLVFKLAELSEGRYTKGYMTTVTEPKMNKTGNEFFGRVKKVSGWGFDTNADYSRKVNLQREREGLEMNFEALPSWAEAINKVVYCHATKREQLYASVYPTSNLGQFTKWFIDGKEATEGEVVRIKEFIPERNETSRQGTEKTVQIRRPKLESIHTISISGERYFVKENVSDL